MFPRSVGAYLWYWSLFRLSWRDTRRIDGRLSGMVRVEKYSRDQGLLLGMDDPFRSGYHHHDRRVSDIRLIFRHHYKCAGLTTKSGLQLFELCGVDRAVAVK